MVAKQVRAAYTQEFRLEVVRLVQSEQSPGAARPATGHHPWACGGAARLSNYRRVCSAHVHASAPAPSCGRPSSLVFSGLQSQALLKMGERRDRRLRRWSFKITSTDSVCLVIFIVLFLSHR